MSCSVHRLLIIGFKNMNSGLQRVSESQNSPTLLCLKQGHLEQVAQNCVLLGFEHLQEWRIHNLSEQPAALELLVQSNCTNSVGYMEGD